MNYKKWLSFLAFLFFVATITENLICGVQTAQNQGELQKILHQHKIAVVNFSSPTCTHCKEFDKSGVFEQLSQEMPDVAFVKVNSTGQGQALHAAHRINGTPTFIFFKNGQRVKDSVGGQFKGHFVTTINQLKK